MSMTRPAPVAPITDERDMYIDLVRVTSVLLIIVGHWFSARVWSYAGRIGVDSVIADIPQLWPGTWIMMAVPMLLFVGGFANSVQFVRWRAARRSAGAFLVRRARRLLAPTGVFLAFWCLVQLLLHLVNVGGPHLVRGVSPRGVVPFAPLWFVGLYLSVIMLCPVTLALHRRFGVAVPVALVVAAAVVDLLRFEANVPYIAWLNLVFTWFLPHQLGYFYADGSLRTLGRAAHITLCAAGLTMLLLVTGPGPYPRPIGRTRDDELSNMAPPTLVIAALALWQVGIVMLASGPGQRLLRQNRIRELVARLNAVTMSLYLWHMTALLVVLLLLRTFGLAAPDQSLASWWLERPVWFALGTLVLLGIIRLVAPVERIR